MLNPIVSIPCAPALNACRRLQVKLLEWLSDPVLKVADITQANLKLRIHTAIEAAWLWDFLQRSDEKQPLLDQIHILVGMSAEEKFKLRAWFQVVGDVEKQFHPGPAPWPSAQSELAIPGNARKALKCIMEAFYEKGLKGTNGIPYKADGTPTDGKGVTYQQFLQEFRDAHRLTPDPHAREVCVLCRGPLGNTPEVDHWVSKAKFSVLSVCGDNLLPVCGDCNSTSNKGEKPVYSNGSAAAFDDWFHPYFRPARGAIAIGYDLAKRTITLDSATPLDAKRVKNLDGLLNLSKRWTKEFKAEYSARQENLRRRIANGLMDHDAQDIRHYLECEQIALVPSEPHYVIHRKVCDAMLDQARVNAWEIELGLI